MPKVKELYISLRDDPDLPIPEGESRESAAWNETSQRTRQHNTNSKALSMAKETSLEKLLTFTSDPEFLHLPSLESILKDIDIQLQKATSPEEEEYHKLRKKAINRHHADRYAKKGQEKQKAFHVDAMKQINNLHDKHQKETGEDFEGNISRYNNSICSKICGS